MIAQRVATDLLFLGADTDRHRLLLCECTEQSALVGLRAETVD